MTIFDPPRGKVIDVQGGGMLRLLGLAFLGFVLVILLFSAVTRVDSGAVGVLTLFGRVTGEALPEGIHLINPLKTNHPFFPIAVDAIRQSRDYDPDQGQASRTTIRRNGEAYQAVITPISFPGWSLVTVVPESEFLGPVQMITRSYETGWLRWSISSRIWKWLRKPATARRR